MLNREQQAKLMESLTKGKAAKVGEVRTRKDGKSYRKLSAGKWEEVKKPSVTLAPHKKDESKPVVTPEKHANENKEPSKNQAQYSVAALTHGVLQAKNGTKYRGFSTGLPSKVAYVSPKGTNTNMVGHVAFGKASKGMQEKLNKSLENAEIILDDLGVKFKTPIDFTCQTMKATANESASYNPLDGFDLNHRIDIRHDTAMQKSLMHEIGHAIDFSAGPEGEAALHDKDSKYLSHSVLDGGKREELKEDLNELMKIAKESEYYQDVKDRKFMRYLTTKTEVFARGFEVLAYKRAEKLVEAGKLDPEVLDQFTPDFVKASKSVVPKDLENQDPELKKVNDELQSKRDEISKIRMAYYAAIEEKDMTAQMKYAAEVRKEASKAKKLDAKRKKLRRKVFQQVRSGSKIENADEVIDKVAGIMERLISQADMKKAMENIDLGALLRKSNMQKMRARGMKRRGDNAKLIDYIQSIRTKDPKLASEIYSELYDEKGKQDTNLAGVGTPEMEKSLISLLKAKTVSRNGEQFYADGPNAGKKVGTVRGTGQADQPGQAKAGAKPDPNKEAQGQDESSPEREEQLKNLSEKVGTILANLKKEDYVIGRETQSQKPMAANVAAAQKIGYDLSDYSDAYNYHVEQSRNVGSFMQKHGISDPKVDRLRSHHDNLAKKFQNERVKQMERQERTAKLDQASKDRADKAKKDDVKKAVIMMNPSDSRELSTADYAKEREESLKSGWLEKLYNAMEDFSYGDLPREIQLDKGTLHLVKVDDGMYTGFVKLQTEVMNEDSGQVETMEDTAKVRMERMTLTEIPNFLMAKEYIRPIPEQAEDDYTPEEVSDCMVTPIEEPPVDHPATFEQYLDSRIEEISNQVTSIQEAIVHGPSPLGERVRILELIAKLTS